MRDEDVKKMCLKYCGNDMAVLKRICFPILAKFGGLSEADYADFYSIANETVWFAARQFNEDENDSFENFLRGCLQKKFKTELTRRNRKRRIPAKIVFSFDAVPTDEHGRAYEDTLDSGFDIENEIEWLKSDGLNELLTSLSKKQVKIIDLIMQGYSKEEIKDMLCISEARYETCIGRLRCFKTLRLLSGLEE